MNRMEPVERDDMSAWAADADFIRRIHEDPEFREEYEAWLAEVERQLPPMMDPPF